MRALLDAERGGVLGVPMLTRDQLQRNDVVVAVRVEREVREPRRVNLEAAAQRSVTFVADEHAARPVDQHPQIVGMVASLGLEMLSVDWHRPARQLAAVGVVLVDMCLLRVCCVPGEDEGACEQPQRTACVGVHIHRHAPARPLRRRRAPAVQERSVFREPANASAVLRPLTPFEHVYALVFGGGDPLQVVLFGYLVGRVAEPTPASEEVPILVVDVNRSVVRIAHIHTPPRAGGDGPYVRPALIAGD